MHLSRKAFLAALGGLVPGLVAGQEVTYGQTADNKEITCGFRDDKV